jgi:hypothetical protein
MPCLLQRLFESPRQGIVACLLRFHGLLEQRLASSGFRFQDARCIAQFRLVAALWHAMTHHATKIRVDYENGVAAGALDLDLAFQLRHVRILLSWWMVGGG